MKVSIWSVLFRCRSAMIGLSIILFILCVAVIGPMVTPDVQISGNNFMPPFGTAIFGTDDLGRDILAQMTRGAGVSLAIGLSAALVSMIIGTTPSFLGSRIRSTLPLPDSSWDLTL